MLIVRFRPDCLKCVVENIIDDTNGWLNYEGIDRLIQHNLVDKDTSPIDIAIKLVSIFEMSRFLKELQSIFATRLLASENFNVVEEVGLDF